MARKRGENQDYYKTEGGSLGRRSYARERRKLASTLAADAAFSGHLPAEPAGPHPAGASAAGAASETAARLRKRRLDRERDLEEQRRRAQEKAVRRDEVQRMVDANVGAAPPGRQLPAARRVTELVDLAREVRTQLGSTRSALHDLLGSLGGLARSPLRLVRILREPRTA